MGKGPRKGAVDSGFMPAVYSRGRICNVLPPSAERGRRGPDGCVRIAGGLGGAANRLRRLLHLGGSMNEPDHWPLGVEPSELAGRIACVAG